MKVKSYLEICLNHIIWQEQVSEFIEYIIFKKYDSNVAYFYAQPFKPELITELFEGWMYEEVSRMDKNCGEYVINRFINNFDMIEISVDFDNVSYSSCSGESAVYVGKSFLIPRTLDDFINDTSRAGIELSWREK